MNTAARSSLSRKTSIRTAGHRTTGFRLIAAASLLAGCTLRSSGSETTATPVDTVAASTTMPGTTVVTPTSAVGTSVVGTSTTSANSTTAPSTSTPDTTVNVGAYFVHAERLTVLGRRVAAATPYSAVQALLAGPTANERTAGVLTLVPAGTRLLGADVKGTEITLDLSHEFERGGGSFAVRMALAQVVYTVTQFQGVNSVRFRIDGEPRDMISGEGIMVDPATPDQYRDDVLPGILLQSPVPGDAYREPITIRGASNVFEATVNYQLVAPNGTVLIEGVTTATCGTGCWGTFRYQLPALPAGTTGPITLRVFDWSEADGVTKLDLVEFVLT